MKKLIITILVLIAAASCWYLFGNGATALAPKHQIQHDETSNIYFFYQDGCPHCDDAEKWIAKNHPDLKMNMINIRKGNGTNKLIEYAGRHSINLQNLGTPLISMGDNYIMGWSDHNADLFNRFLAKVSQTTTTSSGSPK